MAEQVSIVIPLYNKEEHIAATIESVRTQTHRDVEIVVVDDGSTDSGAALVEAIDDPRIRMLKQDNAGPASARNRGAREARGTFLCFLDADDQLYPDFVARHLAKLRSNPSCALSVSCYTRGANRQSNESAMREKGFSDGIWSLESSGNPAEEVYFLAGWACHSGAILVRRDAFTAAGGFYEANRCVYGEDHALWVVLLLRHPAYLLLEPLMWFNTEASTLGPARYGQHPPRPILADPDWFLRRVPAEHRGMIRNLRARDSITHARQCADRGDVAAALRWLGPALRSGTFSVRAVRETARTLVRGLRPRNRREART